MTSAGRLDFTGCALDLPDADSVKSGAFVVATAEDGIVAQPTLSADLVSRGWRLSIGDGGNSLLLAKAPAGFMLIFR